MHTGAGISTSAGIPDFRGPNGVWTLERKGLKPSINNSFDQVKPTKTHMALKALVESGHVKYIISQNIDGLHLKSGLDRQYLSELHGNMFIDQCSKCRRQYIRNTPSETVGQKYSGGICKGGKNARSCRGGQLLDNILDWEHDLPDKDLDLALMHSTLADLNICLGTTLQIVPSGNLPLKNKKYGGMLIICNLQPTKHDKKADLIISSYVDNVLTKLLKKLNIELPEYCEDYDPTKKVNNGDIEEWTVEQNWVKDTEKLYNVKIKEYVKRKKDATDYECDKKIKLKEEE